MKLANDLLTRAVANVIPRPLAEEKLKSKKPLRVYWGIDPTGTKLHLGHTVPMRKLKQFADAGHHVILVIGSFTAMIGDPSGRDTMREPLTKEQVKANFRTYKEQASRILDFGKIEVRENHEWLEKLRFEEILKLASHFTVQQMEERAMFAERMNKGKPVSVHEFLYPLMVGYDSVTLDVDCELGGTDQEFNMLAGRTMQKAFGKRKKFVLTTKLLEGLDGRKMSKTYGNCVYIEDPPNEMYGKLMSLKDELIPIYMECCTDIPMDEIIIIEKKMIQEENPMQFKKQLAEEIVRIYHGEKAAKEAADGFSNVFAKGELPEDIPQIKAKKGESLLDVLLHAGMISSKNDGRRLLEQGGIHLDDKKISDGNSPATPGVYKVGKRKFVKIC